MRTVSAEQTPQALCLCPTRELAKQISMEAMKMGKYHLNWAGLAIKTILREERYEKGDRMKEQIVIGMNKIWTLIGMRVIDTAAIRVFVLDEADEMLMLGGWGHDQADPLQAAQAGADALLLGDVDGVGDEVREDAGRPQRAGLDHRDREALLHLQRPGEAALLPLRGA